MDDHINILESSQDEEITGDSSKLDQELESITGEMEEAREENCKLKALFPKDYQPMQMHFFDILQQDKQEEAAKATGTSHEESGLVSLSLGISSKGPSPTMDEKRSSNKNAKIREENLDNEGLALGLDIRFEPSSSSAQAESSPKRSFAGQGKEEELFEMCPPSKVLNKATTGDSDASQLKKPRVSIRARCDTQTMNDGCQWRKYGQKKAKGSRCPRSYYRCTVSPFCHVKKQVQRCSGDMSILITTYEGTHNHPLPSSATAIASITSAAASMLQSSSLISQQRLANSDPLPIINPSVADNLNALNFTSSCQQFSRTQQLYFPYSSSISTSNSHPTITLDLTAPPTSSTFGKFFPSFSSMPSTNLSFSSTFSPLQSSVIDSSAWINPHSGYFNYEGSIIQNRNQNGSLMNTGKQPFQGHLYQPNYMGNHTISQLPLPDSIASAAAKAITANPKFQSAVALTAPTTYVGDDYGAVGGGVRENHVGAESAALNLKLGGDMPYTKNTVYSSSQNGIGCGSSKSLNLSSSSLDSQQGNITFPLPQPPKSSDGSPFKKSNQLLLPRK